MMPQPCSVAKICFVYSSEKEHLIPWKRLRKQRLFWTWTWVAATWSRLLNYSNNFLDHPTWKFPLLVSNMFPCFFWYLLLNCLLTNGGTSKKHLPVLCKIPSGRTGKLGLTFFRFDASSPCNLHVYPMFRYCNRYVSVIFCCRLWSWWMEKNEAGQLALDLHEALEEDDDAIERWLEYSQQFLVQNLWGWVG